MTPERKQYEDRVRNLLQEMDDRFRVTTGHDYYLPLPIGYGRNAEIRMPSALLRWEAERIVDLLEAVPKVLEGMIIDPAQYGIHRSPPSDCGWKDPREANDEQS